ncbi:MAG: hypothetical protein AAF525_06045 [Pseudomonadota bacterium]
MSRYLGATLCLLWVHLIVSCDRTDQSSPSYDTTVDVAELMHHVVEPAADVIWDSAGSIVTVEGERSLAPTDEAGWESVVHSAVVLSESGNLLMLPGRAPPEADVADWNEIAGGLSLISKKVKLAAEQQDEGALFDAGGELYNVCVSCHQTYWREGQSRFIEPAT